MNFSFAYWVKPKPHDIFVSFLAYYLSRAEICRATAVRAKRSTSSGRIYTAGTQSVKDKAIQDIVKTVNRHVPE